MAIGSIGLFDVDPDSDSCEIGYSIGSRWWGHGYATEAVTAILDYAFGPIGAHRVQATCHPMNTASSHVLEKVGMRKEGIMKDAQRNPDGTYSDLILYAKISSN